MLAFVVVAFATLSAGCVQDGLMDMARFQLKPDDIIVERRPDTAYEMASVRGTPFRRVESLYYDYIRSQSAEVQSMITRMAAIPDGLNQPAEE